MHASADLSAKYLNSGALGDLVRMVGQANVQPESSCCALPLSPDCSPPRV